MKIKVLCADDEEDVLALLDATLGSQPEYEVFLAGDGEEALSMARRHIPDIVFLDIVMPKKDGYEVCRALKGDDDTAHIIVVMLSALTQEIDLRKARESGADDYFTKPFSPIALRVKADELLAPGNQATGPNAAQEHTRG